MTLVEHNNPLPRVRCALHLFNYQSTTIIFFFFNGGDLPSGCKIGYIGIQLKTIMKLIVENSDEVCHRKPP